MTRPVLSLLYSAPSAELAAELEWKAQRLFQFDGNSLA